MHWYLLSFYIIISFIITRLCAFQLNSKKYKLMKMVKKMIGTIVIIFDQSKPFYYFFNKFHSSNKLVEINLVKPSWLSSGLWITLQNLTYLDWLNANKYIVKIYLFINITSFLYIWEFYSLYSGFLPVFCGCSVVFAHSFP